MLTLGGVLGNAGAAVLAARGDFLPAGLVMLAASSLDLLDGALARATGRATAFGSVFDAVMDRVSEAAVLFGLLYYFSDRGGREEELLIFAAVVASFWSATPARERDRGHPAAGGAVQAGGQSGPAGHRANSRPGDSGALDPRRGGGATAIQRLALVWLRARRPEARTMVQKARKRSDEVRSGAAGAVKIDCFTQKGWASSAGAQAVRDVQADGADAASWRAGDLVTCVRLRGAGRGGEVRVERIRDRAGAEIRR
jgi:hypothetical protein